MQNPHSNQHFIDPYPVVVRNPFSNVVAVSSHLLLYLAEALAMKARGALQGLIVQVGSINRKKEVLYSFM